MNRRFFLAAWIALSLHAPMVLLGWLTWPTGGATLSGIGSADTPGVALRLEMVSPVATIPNARRYAPPQDEDILPVDYRPRLGAAPRLSALPSVPPLGAVPAVEASSQPAASGMLGATGLFRPITPAKRVVFVLDRSVSMGLQGMLGHARRELADALQHLSADAWFQIIVYHQSARPLVGPLPGSLQRAESTNIERALVALDEVTAQGGTNHLAGMQAALAMQPEVVVLITDEDDLSEQEERAILRANRGARLEVIEMRRGERREGAFSRLARATGGSHRRFSGAAK